MTPDRGSGVTRYPMYKKAVVIYADGAWRVQLDVQLGEDQDDPAAAYEAAARVIRLIQGTAPPADADAIAAAERRGAEQRQAQIVNYLYSFGAAEAASLIERELSDLLLRRQTNDGDSDDA